MKSRTSASDGEAASLTGRGVRDADPDRDLEPGGEAEFWTPSAPDEHEAASADSVNSSEPVTVIDEPEEPQESVEPGVARSALPWYLRSRGRSASAVALVLLVIAAIYGVSTLTSVRTVLRQSFTQISSPNSQFYLNGNPWVSGQFLNVPLGIIRQGGPRTASYQIHVWTVDHTGKTDASTTVTLPASDGKGTANFKLPIPTDAQLVWAQVEGTSLSVHYRFAGSALPSASASASGSH